MIFLKLERGAASSKLNLNLFLFNIFVKKFKNMSKISLKISISIQCSTQEKE